SRQSGVGYEGDIIAGEVFATGDQRKFIPILRRGKWGEVAPSAQLGKYYIDLSGDPYNEANYLDLLNTLLGRRPKAPPLGPIAGTAPQRKVAGNASPTGPPSLRN